MQYCEIESDCCYEFGSERSFLTREEKISLLKSYKEDLEFESKGVGERIVELEKEGM